MSESGDMASEAGPTTAWSVSLLSSRDTELARRVDDIQRTCFPTSQLHLQEELERPWAKVWVARAAQLGGFLIAWHVADELQILEVGTAGEQRRRGVGKALVQAARTYAAASGCRLILLEVRMSNIAAIQLYRGMGFRTWSLRKNYYSDTGEDALELAYALDERGLASPLADEFPLDL